MILRRFLLLSLVAICGCNVAGSFIESGDRWVKAKGCIPCESYAWRVVPNVGEVCGFRPYRSRQGDELQVLHGCADQPTCTVFSSMSEERARSFIAPGTTLSHFAHEREMHLRACLAHP